MINVHRRSTGEVKTFPGRTRLKSTDSCPAPCCLGRNASEHGDSPGSCLVMVDAAGNPQCVEFFAAADGISFIDCACEGETCAHRRELEALPPERGAPPDSP